MSVREEERAPWHALLGVLLQTGILDRETTEVIVEHLRLDVDVHSVMASRLGTNGMPLLEYVTHTNGLAILIHHLTQFAQGRLTQDHHEAPRMIKLMYRLQEACMALNLLFLPQTTEPLISSGGVFTRALTPPL